jgi:saccharopine dehydrogenase-like NADP-dependent oxidoreductase
VLGFHANLKIVMPTKICQLGNSPVLKYETNSSFRQVSNRLTNDVNSTMSGKYVEIIEFSILHIKAIKYCSHLKLEM